MEQKTINPTEAIKAQRDYLIELSKSDKTWMRDSFAKGVGFAPTNGICYNCRKQIYDNVEMKRRNYRTGDIEIFISKGISVEDASKKLTTGCPHCHRSFVD